MFTNAADRANFGELGWNGIRRCELIGLEGVMPPKLPDPAPGGDALHLESPEVERLDEGQQTLFLNRSEEVRKEDQPGR